MLAAAAALRLALSLPGSVWLAVPLLRISSLFPQNSQHFPSFWLPQNAHPQQFPEEKALAAALFLFLRAGFLSFLDHQVGGNAHPASFRGLFVPFARLLRPALLWVAFSQVFLAFTSNGGENAVLAAFKQLCTFAAPLLLVVCGVNAAVVCLWSARRFCFVLGVDDGEGASVCGVGRSGATKAAAVVIALLAAFVAAFELSAALYVEGLPATMGFVVGVLSVVMLLLFVISLWSEGSVLTDAPLVSLLAAHALRRASVLLGSEVATSSAAATTASSAAAAGKKIAARAARASAASIVDWLLPLPVARKPAAAATSGVGDAGVFADVIDVVRDLATFDDVLMLLFLLFAIWGGRWAAQAKHFALDFPGDEDGADASGLYEDLDLGDRIRRAMSRLWNVIQTNPTAVLILLYTHFVMVLFGDVPGIAPGWFVLEAFAALGTGFVALLWEASRDENITHYHAD
jgi:hypothetical protein